MVESKKCSKDACSIPPVGLSYQYCSRVEAHHFTSQSSIQSANNLLTPLAESIAQQMGSPVVIMIPVPMPERGGDIEVLS